LLELVEPHTAGDPMSTRKWLNARLRDIQARLVEVGHAISLPVISRLLKAHDYRLRVSRKDAEGTNSPERDCQFAYIQEQRDWHEQAGQPTVSIDTKKKELVGNFKNAGHVWCRHPEIVNTHDFPGDAEGRAVPYGVYDLQHNQAHVYVGQSADTAEFAVDNVVMWCQTELRQRFPAATHLMLLADGGGSNASRSRLFKQHLQAKIADAFGLTVTVCHYPPGASKWNPIEHRVFSEISKTWQGCPLRSFDRVLDYISDTKTQTGLTVHAHLVTRIYETGIRVSDAIMKTLNIQRHDVCPQWNYTISPRSQPVLP
jgi:Rhodopirellula transposase DDE domain